MALNNLSVTRQTQIRNIRLFYLHQALHSFGDIILGFVLPLFFLKASGTFGGSFLWRGSLMSLFALTLLPTFLWGVRRGRLRSLCALGVTFYVVASICFAPPDVGRTTLVTGTVFLALSLACYWMPRAYLITGSLNAAQVGRELSNFAIVDIFVSTLGPLIAGISLFVGSFFESFLFGSVLVLLSVTPLLALRGEIVKPSNYTTRWLVTALENTYVRQFRITYFFEGVYEQLFTLSWLYIFTTQIGNVAQYGVLIAVAALVRALTVRLIGTHFDNKSNSRSLLPIVTTIRFLLSLLFLSFFWNTDRIWMLTVITAHELVVGIHQTLVNSYLFRLSVQHDPVVFHFNREVFLIAGRIVTCFLIALLLLWFGDKVLWFNLAIGSFTVFGWLALDKAHGIPERLSFSRVPPFDTGKSES